MTDTLRRQVPRPPLTSTADRLIGLDAARFLAAVAIIWQHTPESPQLKPYGSLAAFAVPFFIAASILMTVESVRRKPDRDFGSYVMARFKRIYVPFLIWTAIYLLIRNLKHAMLSGQPHVPIGPGILVGGSAHHLWFLPFLLVVSVATFALAKLMTRRPIVERIVFVAALIGGVVVAQMPEELLRDQYVLDRAWAALPALLWGLALAAIYPRIPRGIWQSTTTITLGAIVLLSCLPLMLLHWRSHLTENLAGVALLLVALCEWHTSLARRLAAFAPLAYGIYLSHVMFIEGAQAIAARLGYRQLWWLDLGVFLFAAGAALSFTRVLSRWRSSGWLLPS